MIEQEKKQCKPIQMHNVLTMEEEQEVNFASSDIRKHVKFRVSTPVLIVLVSVLCLPCITIGIFILFAIVRFILNPGCCRP